MGIFGDWEPGKFGGKINVLQLDGKEAAPVLRGVDRGQHGQVCRRDGVVALLDPACEIPPPSSLFALLLASRGFLVPQVRLREPAGTPTPSELAAPQPCMPCASVPRRGWKQPDVVTHRTQLTSPSLLESSCARVEVCRGALWQCMRFEVHRAAQHLTCGWCAWRCWLPQGCLITGTASMWRASPPLVTLAAAAALMAVMVAW